ncbi:MAG TPA: hypothetical protein VGB97_00425 [Candidatus Paceibacterota bacterium]|jgi:hypothetical protein
MKAEQSQDSAFTVVICNQGHHIHTPRHQRRVFGESEKRLKKALAAKGFRRGSFRLIPVKATPGSSSRQGIKFASADEENRRISMTIQPGSCDTAWQYWLEPPREVSIRSLFEAFTSSGRVEEERPLAPEALEQPELQPEPQLEQGAEDQAPEPAIVEPAPPPVPVASPTSFATDLPFVALTFDTCFRKPDSRPAPEDLIAVLMDEMGWDEKLAAQGYQCLVNRGHLKVHGVTGNERVLIGSDELRAAFREIGIHQETRESSAQATVSAILPVPTSRAVRPFRASNEPSVPPVAQPKPAPAPASIFATLAEMEERALTYEKARGELVQCVPAQTALIERIERARLELDTAQHALSELEQRMAAQQKIVSDPAYSEAADKLSQIKAIIG